MKYLTLLLLLAACDSMPDPVDKNSAVRRWHDDEKNVTCYMLYSGYGVALHCVPDSELAQTEHGGVAALTEDGTVGMIIENE